MKVSNSWAGYHILLNPDYSAQILWRFVNRAIDEVENHQVTCSTVLLQLQSMCCAIEFELWADAHLVEACVVEASQSGGVCRPCHHSVKATFCLGTSNFYDMRRELASRECHLRASCFSGCMRGAEPYFGKQVVPSPCPLHPPFLHSKFFSGLGSVPRSAPNTLDRSCPSSPPPPTFSRPLTFLPPHTSLLAVQCIAVGVSHKCK